MPIISRGESRLVIAFPTRGFVIKVPVFAFGRDPKFRKESRKRLAGTLIHFLRDVTMILRRPLFSLRYPGNYWHWVQLGFGVSVRAVRDVPLLRGIRENRRERRYCRQAGFLELMLIVPTYFSLFGLINVQRYEEPSGGDRWLVAYLFSTLTKKMSERGTHHFQNPANFTGFERGYIKALDYGDPLVQSVLSEYALRLLRRVDLDETRRWYSIHLQRIHNR